MIIMIFLPVYFFFVFVFIYFCLFVCLVFCLFVCFVFVFLFIYLFVCLFAPFFFLMAIAVCFDKGTLQACHWCQLSVIQIQIQIQLYLTTEGPLQLKVVLPWGRGYNIIKIFKETYLQIDTYIQMLKKENKNKLKQNIFCACLIGPFVCCLSWWGSYEQKHDCRNASISIHPFTVV